MNPKDTPLLPCPFCPDGGKPTRRHNQQDTEHWVTCATCGGMGPWRKFRKDADHAWNQRHTKTVVA